MITGTTGKTTTVRMLAHVLAESGHLVGYTCTGGVVIAGETVSESDSSGYYGAARVMKNPRVTAAVLETARGDLLRNGIYLDRCEVAALLNVGRGQIGIDGVDTVEEMTAVKRRVVDAARKAVVLNADDSSCRGLIDQFPPSSTKLFTLEASSATIEDHLRRGGAAFCYETTPEPRIVRRRTAVVEPVVSIARLPSSLNGMLRHNIANAMAAAALADGLGLSLEAIGSGLSSFDTSIDRSPGRFNVIRTDPAFVVVDSASSPPAAKALVESVTGLAIQGRRLCTLTTAGNRAAWHYDEFTEILASTFDYFVCYESDRYRRGRAPGEIAELLRSGLVRAGADARAIAIAEDAFSALDLLLAEASPGDLAVVLGYYTRHELLEVRDRVAMHAFESSEERADVIPGPELPCPGDSPGRSADAAPEPI